MLISESVDFVQWKAVDSVDFGGCVMLEKIIGSFVFSGADKGQARVGMRDAGESSRAVGGQTRVHLISTKCVLVHH